MVLLLSILEYFPLTPYFLLFKYILGMCSAKIVNTQGLLDFSTTYSTSLPLTEAEISFLREKARSAGFRN